jgi:site-specific DNA-adenine methylase
MQKNISYPGNKGVNPLLPNIINLIPPHKHYVELFLGSAGVARHIYPAVSMVGVERSQKIIERFRNDYPTGMVVINDCAISWLLRNLVVLADTFIYLDPPYLKQSRRSIADIYDYEISVEDHIRLLKLITSINAMVMISGYDSDLYNTYLWHWNKRIFNTSVHGKQGTEIVWFNYPEPTVLHQYNYYGKDKTDRQRVRRKIERWSRRLNQLPAHERQAIMLNLK